MPIARGGVRLPQYTHVRLVYVNLWLVCVASSSVSFPYPFLKHDALTGERVRQRPRKYGNRAASERTRMRASCTQAPEPKPLSVHRTPRYITSLSLGPRAPGYLECHISPCFLFLKHPSRNPCPYTVHPDIVHLSLSGFGPRVSYFTVLSLSLSLRKEIGLKYVKHFSQATCQVVRPEPTFNNIFLIIVVVIRVTNTNNERGPVCAHSWSCCVKRPQKVEHCLREVGCAGDGRDGLRWAGGRKATHNRRNQGPNS